MSFYELSKEKRNEIVASINKSVQKELIAGKWSGLSNYFDDEDTYIRKAAYQAIGKIYFAYEQLQSTILLALTKLLSHDSFRVRQTAINAAGEIGKKDFAIVEAIFDKGLFDEHHSPRNAVIGSVKKMGEVNPAPVLKWAKKYLHHTDKEIRREICHGIELRGRTHPQDILPLLKELQDDPATRVRKTLVHVIGQIAYKKGCLQIVVAALMTWHNKTLVRDALDEIIDVHERYKNFATMTQAEAISCIDKKTIRRPLVD